MPRGIRKIREPEQEPDVEQDNVHQESEPEPDTHAQEENMTPPDTTIIIPVVHKQRAIRKKSIPIPVEYEIPTDLQEDELKLAQSIESQIHSFKNSEVFKHELTDINFNDSNRPELLKSIETRVSGTVSMDYMSAVLIAFQQLEIFVNSRTDDMFLGLAKNLYEDLSIRKNIELLKIKYMSSISNYVQLGPEYCLIISIAYVSVKTFMVNKKKNENLEYQK